MEPVIRFEGARVFHGDCRDVLAALPDNSVDSIVTDPPYELGFMGKSWDASGIAYNSDVWEQCLRVLKPGGHLLAFGGTRTWHRLAVAVEDAGFEVRDSIAWIYGQGFPKSMDISKAIDKAAGVEREVIGRQPYSSAKMPAGDSHVGTHGAERIVTDITAPSSPEAKKWQGWGTALKPAFEPIVVARKPLSGTVAETVLEWGTGGLNIDGSRIGTADELGRPQGTMPQPMDWGKKSGEKFVTTGSPQGRWPANVILDEVTAGLLDEQSGERKSGGSSPNANRTAPNGSGLTMGHMMPKLNTNHAPSEGGASRFFYCAKASKRDRNEGLEELEAVDRQKWNGTVGHRGVGDFYPDGSPRPVNPQRNTHPTVKPTQLMRYLIKLVTPPGGTVLDPFTGSGSTGKAAILEGFDFVGVELTEDYLPIIEGRLKWALENQDEGTLF